MRRKGLVTFGNKHVLAGTSLAAVMIALLPSAAFAQVASGQPDTSAPPVSASDTPDSSTTNAAAAAKDSDIVVTGTRIVRDGFKAPTPTTVLGAQEISSRAPANLADYVNTLPSLQSSSSPRNQLSNTSAGTAGVNALNLRNLGGNRTLVLLDEQRFGGSTLGGLVDINLFPQQLVSRVDIVTGGASAGYGSDAVAGVVNFVLDRKFTGLKGDAQGGVTTYGDDTNYRLSLTGGASFLDGRGHIIASAEYAYNDGISGTPRNWYRATKLLINPSYTATNGQPQLLVRDNTGFSTVAPGGIITSTALAGTYFGPGGTPAQLNYGSIVSAPFMTGGDWQYTDFAKTGDLDPRLTRTNAFGRVSFDLTDHIELFGQFSFGRVTSRAGTALQYNFGNLTIRSDNAFIPTSVATRLAALGITSFSLGTTNQDLGIRVTSSDRKVYRPVIGIDGDFDALGSNWKWNAYAQRTKTVSYVDAFLSITANYNAAVDAVRNATGVIVCRSTLTNPTNGCVPYNVFGTGVNSQAALNYIKGHAFGRNRITEDVAAANLRGNPFSSWAGPISVALGFEHRRERVAGSVDALDAASQALALANNTARTPPYFAGNYLPSFGSYTVNEGYLETVIPLAKDTFFAKSLDFNGAVRETDYSLSGSVTTWKVGLTYQPIDGITFRATRSRDVRAANLSELFQASSTGTVTIVDPARNNASASGFQVTSGNLGLKPEKADTLGVGLVVEPRFLPGFSASVDYFNIDIKGAITTLTAATLVNQCYAGNTALCSSIIRGTTGAQINGLYPIAQVLLTPINLSKQVSRGLDFEASYRHDVFDGRLTLRAFATRNLKNVTNNGITAPLDLVGTNSANGNSALSLPRWSYSGTASYQKGPATVTFTARGFSSGVYNTNYVQCTSGCPTSTTDHMTIDNNRIPGAIYFDASTQFKLTPQLEMFLAVDNIANRAPAQIGYGPSIVGNPISINPALYDVIGRAFRAGVRFKL